MKKALITGITGQDGAYLAEFLLGKGYQVHGIKRRTSLFNTDRIDHLYRDPHEKDVRFFLHHGDLTDSSSLIRIIQQTQPDEMCNLAAQSHVAVSFEEPEYTANSDALGALRILEAIRILGLEKKTRFYQASTSELFGLVQEIPQKETTPRALCYPKDRCRCLPDCPRQPRNLGIGRYVHPARLGLGAGIRRDHVAVLQRDTPEDYVIATGETRPLTDFVDCAFRCAGLNWRDHVVSRPDPRRPMDIPFSRANPAKARERLGWRARHVMESVVAMMVAEERETLSGKT